MSTAFRRTLLTSTRSLRSTTPLTPNTFRPIFATTNRYFSATMGKEGVHVLASKAEYEKAREDKDTLMVIDCYATWCGPCKVIAPQVVKFSDVYPNVRFYKVDVDEVPEVAQELSVRAMPTFFLFKGDSKEPIETVVGANPKALETAIQQHA